MMNCSSYESLFTVGNEHRLDSKLQTEFDQHREACRHCAAFRAEDAYLRMRMQTVAVETSAPSFHPGFFKAHAVRKSSRSFFTPMRGYSFAAGVLAGVVLVASVLTMRTPVTAPNSMAQNTRDTVERSAPVVKPAPEAQYALRDSNTIQNDSQKTEHKAFPTANVPQQFQSVSGQ